MLYLSAMLPLFAGIVSLCLGIVVYYLSRGKIRRIFLRFCFITFYWQFSWVILFLSPNSEYADLICKIGYSGIIFLPLTCYETAAHYLKISKKDIFILYFVCFGFLFSLWRTDLFIQGHHLYWFGYYPKANVLHGVYLLMVVYLLTKSTYIMIRFHRKETDPVRKAQLKFFLLAAIVFSISGIDYLLNYPFLVEKLGFNLYPVGVFFVIFSVFIFVLSHFITLNLTLEKRVTEQTQQLKNSVDALEKAASAKKDFIANVTHELRTPLTLIRGWTDYMLEGEVGTIPAKLSEIMGKIGIQTLSLTHKINELLKVSKFDAGMDSLALSRINIDTHIFQIVSSFRGLTEASQVGLTYHSNPDIPEIFIDREKLTDILNNLIRNAYKFTEMGDISVTLKDNGDYICIEVKDTGVGMSSDVVETIFNRFQQGDSSKTRMYEGTGLGLAIVKESAERMYGRVSVTSVEEEGTSFILELPRDLEKKEPGSITDRRQTERRGKNVVLLHPDRRENYRRNDDLSRIEASDIVQIDLLENKRFIKGNVEIVEAENSKGNVVIAEDTPGILEFLSRALKDYTLYLTTDGREAWNTIKKVMPDLVISDIMMPHMDGFSLLKHIRTHKQTTSIPVIIITSLSEQEDRIKSLQLGADDFLTKPFHHLELQARVKNVISLHTLEREKTRREQLEVFLMVLASAIESKDSYTGGHVERVANYSRDLAEKIGLSPFRVNEIYMGAIVHDVGKIGIKDVILNKPGKLTDDEFDQVKEHPLIGKNILSKLEIAPVAVNIAYYHQEKWNGTGYPTGTKGKAIPLEARIATIADIWDAITSDRPYRKAIPLSQAIQIMELERGKSLDPELHDLFMNKEYKIYLNYIPEEQVAELYSGRTAG
ncbi:HD domain-containing phosphohydrolase [Desulfobacula sp.]|uniref:HD domain-containing phosphohydrolase n=1 Tax=Desulfobacula sp. TaxID=2593537 RepID=UPI00261725B1|nr:HD domain-containing phosphohydrolase [Desulfobacula sp.]